MRRRRLITPCACYSRRGADVVTTSLRSQPMAASRVSHPGSDAMASGRSTRQHLQPRQLSRSPAPDRAIRPVSGPAPPPSRLCAEPHDLRLSEPEADTTRPAQSQTGTSDTAPRQELMRAVRILRRASRSIVACDCPQSNPGHAHLGPDPALTCPSTHRARRDLFFAFGRAQKGH